MADNHVAVVMTCYNEGTFIESAVRSVLNQTIASQISEILIMDDGSDESTLQALRSVAKLDDRIIIDFGNGGTGLPAQRNLAISRTTAPLVAILDGDDVWLPKKLETQLPLFDDPDVGLVYTDYFVSSDLNTSIPVRAGVLDICKARDLEVAYFLNDPPIIPSTVVFRRTLFDAVHGFDPTIRVFEDTDFFLRCTRKGQFAVADEPLILKRNHSSSITNQRRDLMMHHALVAFKAARDSPALLPLVPRRLAERARKLGNRMYLQGNVSDSRQLLSLSARLNPANLRTWTSLLAVSVFPRGALRLLGERGRKLQDSIGAARGN